MVNYRKVMVFLGVSFVWSWSIALILFLTGLFRHPLAFLLVTAYMFGPLVGTFVSKKIYKESFSSIGINFKVNRWWVIGWFIPVIFAVLTVFIGYIMGGGYISDWETLKNKLVSYFPDSNINAMQIDVISSKIKNIHIFYLISLISGMISGVTVNAVAAFGEEAGWRGFLFEELAPFGFINYSLIIGFIWGVWHAPIIALGHNFPSHPFYGIFLMICFCIVFTFILNYFRLKSNSVILSSIMHGTLNGVAGIYIYANYVKNDILYNIVGISGIIAGLVIVATLFLIDRKAFLFRKS